MFSAVDPIYMLMLIKRLGPDYIVWDKATTIRFRRPGRSTLFARIHVPDQEIEEIHRRFKTETTLDRAYPASLTDEEGEVYATVEKLLHFRKIEPRR